MVLRQKMTVFLDFSGGLWYIKVSIMGDILPSTGWLWVLQGENYHEKANDCGFTVAGDALYLVVICVGCIFYMSFVI